jgi:hypothetical protein
MKIQSKIINTYDKLYHSDIYLFLAPRDAITGIFKRKWDFEYTPKSHHKAESFSIETSGWIRYIIWMDGFNWTVDDQRTLVHEIFHTVARVMNDRGVIYSPDNTEPYAYYFDMVFAELWNKLSVLHCKVIRRRRNTK